MSETIPVLVLRLEGVLQSWGEHSKWDWRDSALMPTKSGVIGLLGCALGLERGDSRLPRLSESLAIGVRADRPGQLLTDFQTVQSEKMLNAMGKPRTGGNTLTTHRTYLQDACFTVAITGKQATLEKLAQALKAPKWPIYLGRKSCVPTRPVLDCLTDRYRSVEDALCRIPVARRPNERRQRITMLAEFDAADGTEQHGAVCIRNDRIAPGLRRFQKRFTLQKPVEVKEENDVSEQNTIRPT